MCIHLEGVILLTKPQAGFVERNFCINCDSTDLHEVSHGRYTDSPLRDFLEADPWGECPTPYLQEAEWTLFVAPIASRCSTSGY